MRSIQTNPMIFMSDRLSVAFSFSRRAHLLTTCKAGGGIPPVGQARALLTNCLPDSSPERAGNVASEHSLCSRLYILHYQQNDEVAYYHPISPPACENLPPAALSQIWAAMQPIFSLQRETETKGWRFTTPSQNTNRGERKWQFTTWRQRWSAGEPDAPPVQPPLISAAPTSSMTMTEYSTITPESRGLCGRRYSCRTWPHPHGKTERFSGTPWRKTRKPRTAA